MIYRKQGLVVRWENGTHIRVTESGRAREKGEYFECAPVEPRAGFSPPMLEDLKPVVRFSYERLILIEGYAEHEYGAKRWSEHARRLHASLTHGTLRALVDQATFDMAHIELVASALRRAEQRERAAPRHVRLAPNVAAAVAAAGALPVVQTAGGVDGYGDDIVEARGEWPNWYRPSYRTRPVRMPLNVRFECERTDVDEDLPRAIALLAPVADRTARVLVVDGDAVYPATVTISRIEAARREWEWYPYGGGSFGAELMF